jgi:hypothetical protein
MNVSLVTGFIIGGMLMLSLMALNNRISQNTGMVVLQQISQQRIDAIAEIVSSDFRKIGQGGSGQNAITNFTENTLTFTTSFDGIVLNTISWVFDTTATIERTPNLNDRMLLRIENGDSTRIDMGVTQFTMNYFDSDGNIPATRNDIRRIQVQLMVEGDAAYGNEISRLFWESNFTPRAIQ